ncbi:hypothetical protein JB92DRAFT_2805596 [Gautieria morchelliformis]|nr:hypothetical protein JB92DRAFT_2805596 [Gautieria morchelliformis]
MDDGFASNPPSRVGHSSSTVPTNRPPALGSPTHVEVFPGPAGEAHAHGTTRFDLLHETQRNPGRSLYEPFADQEEWELTQTLMTSGMSFTNMDKLLKLPIVSLTCMTTRMQTSFTNKRTLLAKVDALPPSGPEFLCESITVHGDVKDANGEYMVEELELFYQDPVECVRELMGNPAFHEVLHYVPEHIFEDEKRTEHIYNEMWMADWWWDLQVSPTMIIKDPRAHPSWIHSPNSPWGPRYAL